MVSQGAVEEVYDFSRNQFARFTAEGFGAGYDAGSVGVNIYAGRGWKNSVRADNLVDAYAGPSMALTGTVNAKNPLIPSPTAAVSAIPMTETAWTPNFAGVVTFTWSIGKAADVRRDVEKFMPIDPHVSFVKYAPWGSPRTFVDDNEFIGFIWTRPLLSWPEKVDLTFQVLLVDEVKPR